MTTVEATTDIERLMLEDLDVEYVQTCAEEIAAALDEGRTIGTCFQPGDGTAYRLVFTPLADLATCTPRVKNGQVWEDHPWTACGGDAVLVSWIEKAAYPINLGSSRSFLHYSYVAEHWHTTDGSGATLAIFFRAIAAARKET